MLNDPSFSSESVQTLYFKARGPPSFPSLAVGKSGESLVSLDDVIRKTVELTGCVLRIV